LRIYRDFCDFQDGGSRYLGFSKIQNFNGRCAVRGDFASVLNFIKIGQTVADIWRFNSFFKWRPSAILMITGGLYLEIHLKAELT